MSWGHKQLADADKLWKQVLLVTGASEGSVQQHCRAYNSGVCCRSGLNDAGMPCVCRHWLLIPHQKRAILIAGRSGMPIGLIAQCAGITPNDAATNLDIYTRLGRYAARERERRGEGKPETFDFLGFTHFCAQLKKNGSFTIGRKTIKKRMVAKLRALKVELCKRMHDPIATTGEWLNLFLKGHLNYFAIPGNSESLWWFCNEVRGLWLRSLRRRSQKAYLSWEKFLRRTGRFFPPIKILHPLPLHRFDARTRGRSPVR